RSLAAWVSTGARPRGRSPSITYATLRVQCFKSLLRAVEVGHDPQHAPSRSPVAAGQGRGLARPERERVVGAAGAGHPARGKSETPARDPAQGGVPRGHRVTRAA